MFPIDAELWTRIVILLLVIVCVCLALRPRYSWRVVVEHGRVKSHQGLAKAQVPRVVEFLERDVAVNKKLTVLGSRDANNVLRISFRGKVDEGTCQQIRNYLRLVL